MMDPPILQLVERIAVENAALKAALCDGCKFGWPTPFGEFMHIDPEGGRHRCLVWPVIERFQ